MSNQSISDRINAARLSIAGQGLAKSVCKATTEEVIGPKKKHLDYLLHCTNEPNVSIPQMANCLIERTNHTSWVVVFKALITVHHLMCYGNERFTQYLASSNCNFQLGAFLDKTGVQGYDMSTFIRRYAKYLNEKAISYRTVAFDFCKVKRGKDDGILRTMNAEKLLKTLPGLQSQLDALLEFDCTANELTNGVINTAFMLLFRDLIRLFACYNDGIINLLEKYFDMNKKMCRDALDIYKKFLIRMDRVAEFLKTAENVGIDKGDIPDLTKAPGSLLDALEQHLAALEGKKGGPGGATTPTQATAGRQSSVKNAVLALSNTSSAFGTAAASSTGPRQNRVNGSGPGLGEEDDHLKQLALEEEQAILELHKERRIKELAGQSFPSDGAGIGGSSTNPFLSSPTDENNLFGSPPGGSDLVGITSSGKASDDLLCLANNPFSDGLNIASTQPSTNLNSFWTDQNGMSAPNNSFIVPESSFSAVFGTMSNAQALGTNQAVHGPTPEGTTGSEKATSDLTIPGLNPFEGVSSATPSPSVPFEFGGLGTTPILGGPDQHAAFAVASFADFGAQEKPRAAGGFDSGFGFGGDSIALSAEPALRLRPLSPAPGTQAPKPTPASSPPPPAPASQDAFGDLAFRGQALASDFMNQGSLFDPRAASPATGQSFGTRSPLLASPSRSAPASGAAGPASAVDDLNAAIKAALTGSPQAMGGTPSGGTNVRLANDVAMAGMSSSSSANFNQGLGFGSPNKMAADFDAFGDILQPVSTSATSSSTSMSQAKSQSKVITGDLDSSLASLAQNLSINRPGGLMQKSGNMWNSPKNTAKTGGANWTPQIASSTAAPAWNSPQHTYQPMVANTSGRPADWSSGMMAGHFPPAVGQTQFSGGPTPAAPAAASGAATATKGFPAASGVATPPLQPFQSQPRSTAAMDPFGAL